MIDLKDIKPSRLRQLRKAELLSLALDMSRELKRLRGDDHMTPEGVPLCPGCRKMLITPHFERFRQDVYGKWSCTQCDRQLPRKPEKRRDDFFLVPKLTIPSG